MILQEKRNQLAKVLCKVDDINKCPYCNNGICDKFDGCKIGTKTEEQIDYILSDNNKCVYLEACAGSGKTESLGMKAAYEICNWTNKKTGIAVLTFTNEAAKTITERVHQFYSSNLTANHYIGTFTSFIHGYIAQKFGYASFQKDNKQKDRSFTLVDTDVKIYDNMWLKNYEVDFPLPAAKKIYANQLDFHLSDKSWYVHQGDHIISLNEFYAQSDVQERILNIRKSKSNDHLFKIEYFSNKILECKKKFWNDGFATFEDMNVITSCCLSKKSICKKISYRFPLILIDECQDLSAMELRILQKLQEGGSCIHFIGDLNQAIYSFKDAFPETTIKHIESNGFSTMKLSNNFRSTQKIVDVSCKLQGITSSLIGNENSLFDGKDAVYFEYDNEFNAIEIFEEYLSKKGISSDSAVVLTRSATHKSLLSTNKGTEHKIHPIINAIQFWHTPNPASKKISLQLMGYQIQKWIKTKGRADSYYCPTEFCEVYRWRLVLRDILNDLCANPTVNNFKDITYSQWYNSAKKTVVEIIGENIEDIVGKGVISDITIRTPSGTANKPIEMIDLCNNNSVNVETIHSVKGCSYSAVMLVSTPNSLGKTGYWEKWINDKQETTRMAYVASTRPKHLLCWALPKLTDEQRTEIEKIGFTKLG